MNTWVCGYKAVPVEGYTMRGRRQMIVGITYARSGQEVLILEQWVNPASMVGLDHVDMMTFMAAAARKVMNSLPPMVEKEWKGVVYG